MKCYADRYVLYLQNWHILGEWIRLLASTGAVDAFSVLWRLGKTRYDGQKNVQWDFGKSISWNPNDIDVC